MIGRIIGNRYEIVEKLGGGGMALVYKARDQLLSRMVTIKVLREQLAGDADFIKRFRREAQAVARLSHPNIVSIYDVGEDKEVYYLVMEYVDGEKFEASYPGKNKGYLPWKRLILLCKSVKLLNTPMKAASFTEISSLIISSSLKTAR
jgi:serine/threonine protein kinase